MISVGHNKKKMVYSVGFHAVAILRTSSTFDGYFPPGQRQFRWWCWGGAEKHKYVASL